MPSLLARLVGAFPGFRGRATLSPVIDPLVEKRANLVARTKEQLANTPARPRPSSEERLPLNWHGGIAGKVWFLPYSDSATKDTPEIRAAMRLMRRDPYVKAGWVPQILTVASEDWQVQPAEAGNPESEEQADFCRAVIEEYLDGGMNQLVQSICAPLGSDGFCLAEKVWEVAKKGRLEKKVVARAVKARDADSSAVRLEGDAFGNVLWVQSNRTAKRESFPISDFIYSRYLTVFDEPLGEAAFRSVYGTYWMRDTVRKLRVIHHEKKMGGFLVGTYAHDEERGQLETTLRQAKTATWATVPEGVRIEAVNLSTATEPDYKSFDESLREEIVTGLAFATLQTIQGNVPDARGDSKVQKATADLGPWLLMTIVCEAVNKQFFPDLIDFNYPYAAGGGYPKLTFGSVSNAELLERLQILEGVQRAGFNPSRKQYAKDLSIQEADPNDPEDALAPPGGMGGFPPPGGGLAGDPAMLPPFDPMGGGGDEAALFSEEEWESFRDRADGEEWETRGRWFKREGGKTRRIAKPGAKAQAAPAQPAAQPAAPARRGLGARVASAAKAVARGAKALPAKAGGGGARVAGAVAATVEKVGAKAKKLKGLERRLGIGRAIEKAGKRARARSAAIAKAYAERGWLGGQWQAAREVVRAMGVHWKDSRRKYGFLPAVAIEGVMSAFALTKGILFKGLGVAASLHVPGAGKILQHAVAYSRLVVTPLVRKVVEFPFKAATRALSSSKRNPNAAGRVSTATPGAAPPATAARAKAIAHDSQQDLYPEGGGASRKRRFSEFADADPLDMVVDLRTWIDEYLASQGEPPITETDEELAELLSGTMDAIEESVGQEFAEEHLDFAAFAESHLSYEAFAWQAARTRTNTLKAVGTGEHAGRVLYGAQAREALARRGGAGRRQQTPRDVSYGVTDPEGNVTPKKETGVSPERARAMAIAGAAAALEPGGTRPTDVTVRKQRRPKAEAVEELGQKVAAGDPRAATELQAQAETATQEAAAELAKDPPKPEEVKAAWAEAMQSGGKARSGDRFLGEVEDTLGNFFAGAVGSGSAEGIAGGLGKAVNWLVRMGGRVLKAGVKALVRFGRWAVRRAGSMAWEVAKPVGAALWRNAKPFLWWAGSLAVGGAIMASPVVAVQLGLMKAVPGMILSPLAIFLGWRAGRRVGQNAIDEGLKNTGNVAIARNAEYFCGKPGEVLRFGEKDVALAGPDGARAAELLKDSQQDLGRLFAEKCRGATERLLASENPMAATILFDDDELSEIAGGLARVITSADLLGRARIRRRAEMAELVAGGAATFAEVGDDPFHDFAEPVPVNLTPKKALEWMRARVPTVADSLDRYGARLDRHATTLAIASDETLLQKIKDAVLKELEGGGDATPDIEKVLDAAGVNPKNPDYASMLARTNAMQAYNQGAADELSEPGMRESFPAWQYLGVEDSRTGDDHRPKIGKYYPSTANFADVRGPRIFNCRCSLAPVSKHLMADIRVEERW
jgi:hypothetical protein